MEPKQGEKFIYQSPEEQKKAEFRARQQKFKELIASAPRFEVLEKVVETYMKNTKIRVASPSPYGSEQVFTGEQIVGVIRKALETNNPFLVPRTLGLQEKVIELLKNRPEELRKRAGDAKAKLWRDKEEAQIERVHQEEHPRFEPEEEDGSFKQGPEVDIGVSFPDKQETSRTLDDVKVPLYQLVDEWDDFWRSQGRQVPAQTKEQAALRRAPVSMRRFLMLMYNNTDVRWRPAIKNLFGDYLRKSKWIEPGTDTNLDFLDNPAA